MKNNYSNEEIAEVLATIDTIDKLLALVDKYIIIVGGRRKFLQLISSIKSNYRPIIELCSMGKTEYYIRHNKFEGK